MVSVVSPNLAVPMRYSFRKAKYGLHRIPQYTAWKQRRELLDDAMLCNGAVLVFIDDQICVARS